MLFPAAVFLAALFLGQGSAQDGPASPCAAGCIDGVFLNAADLGCALGDKLCVCGQTTAYVDGIRDCINQACPQEAAAQIPIAEGVGAQQCAAASQAAGILPAPTPTTPPATPEAPTATPEPTSSATVAETATATPEPSPPSAVSSSETASSEALSAASVEPSASSSTSVAVEPTLTSSSTPSLTATGSSSATQGGATSSTEQPNVVSSASEEGLSVAAKAGIGAGVGVVVVFAALFLLFIWLSRRKKRATADVPSLQISEPLPGSGRQYADNPRRAEATLSTNFTPSPQSSESGRSKRSPQRAYTPSVGSYSSELDANFHVAQLPAVSRPDTSVGDYGWTIGGNPEM
ncbi:hypothetical protein GGS23DRAFT_599035 [Durotheca rogersii]|uniref:uncharacterized protein n=1 Tax=Durotheca rogersii TaxID=419775 RepID=UPI002220444E|nr:uncharacterized protein GGS23DRAFT_599035 [Durotheca rogersii]KAI5860815.1 hypothetical protein GGS23DRAFT_599035 [Durotheca rogersii]